MNTTQQQCFIEAAERMNFTAAAEQLYISQPALSRNISSLEDELGVMLFKRRNNVLTLTRGGEIIYQWMKANSASLEIAVREAKKANSSPQGELVLGFVHNEIPSERDSKTIELFRKKYPEVDLSIQHHPAHAIIENLTEQRMDIAVMIGSAAYGNQRLRYLESALYRRCVATSIAHPLANEDIVSLKEFSEDLFLSLKPEVSPTMSKMIKGVCAEAGFVPRIQELDSVAELIALVESGKGVAVLVDNHMARFDPLIKMVHIHEYFPVSLICVWDKLNANPSVVDYLDIYKSIS